jgi:hypothetical protein
VELESALAETTIPIEEIIAGGGGEAKGTQRLRRALTARGWVKTTFVVEKRINDVPRESQSHEVDHVREFEDGSRIALEIEWNNKDPFFDRDLENFKRLHGKLWWAIVRLVIAPREIAEGLAIGRTALAMHRKICRASMCGGRQKNEHDGGSCHELAQHSSLPACRCHPAVTISAEGGRLRFAGRGQASRKCHGEPLYSLGPRRYGVAGSRKPGGGLIGPRGPGGGCGLNSQSYFAGGGGPPVGNIGGKKCISSKPDAASTPMPPIAIPTILRAFPKPRA